MSMSGISKLQHAEADRQECSVQWSPRSSLCLLQKVNVSPAYLRNDGNKYLNYTDDWYVLKPRNRMSTLVIYYRGNNDAWKGYGGATVYTRCAPG